MMRAGRVEAVVPSDPSGLGWLPDGRLLVVSMRDRRVLRREAEQRPPAFRDVEHLRVPVPRPEAVVRAFH